MKKILIVFYSRTGTTKKVVTELAAKLGATLEEIVDFDRRRGPLGYLRSGREAMTEKLAQISAVIYQPQEFDLVIIATPVWAYNMSSPIRTYLTTQVANFKTVAFIATQGSSGAEKVFAHMSKLIKQTPVATASFLTKDIIDDNFADKLQVFINQVH